MAYIREIITAVGALGCALGIGFIMQNSETAAERYGAASDPVQHEHDVQSSDAETSFLDVRNIELTSAAFELAPALSDIALPKTDRDVILAVASEIQPPELGQAPQLNTLGCEVVAKARPMAAAMVNLTLDAPCLPNERLTVHHNGMIFTQTTSSAGSLDINVPALCTRSLCPIEIFGSSRLTGSGLACLRARQGVPGELISEDVAAA